MTHMLTLVADRTATTLDPATVARVRDAIQGGEPDPLSPGEAADIACAGRPISTWFAPRSTARRSTPSRSRRSSAGNPC